MVKSICVVTTDFGTFPAPPHMIKAADGVKWRKYDPSWPDMRTKAGKAFVKLFREFSEQKRAEYLRQ